MESGRSGACRGRSLCLRPRLAKRAIAPYASHATRIWSVQLALGMTVWDSGSRLETPSRKRGRFCYQPISYCHFPRVAIQGAETGYARMANWRIMATVTHRAIYPLDSVPKTSVIALVTPLVYAGSFCGNYCVNYGVTPGSYGVTSAEFIGSFTGSFPAPATVVITVVYRS
jgi:hypothetical protein